MKVSLNRAAQLVKRIVMPSNQETKPGEGDSGFNPDKSAPIYGINFDGPATVAQDFLFKLYHERDRMRDFEPDDYRIGSNSSLQADINEFARMFVYSDNTEFLQTLLNSRMVTVEQLDKALMLSNIYSGVSEAEYYFQYLRSQKYCFSEDVWSKISGHNGLAYDDPDAAERILGEILKIQDRAVTYSGSFNQWTHSFRGGHWMFEKFLRRVNGFEATGKKSNPDALFAYRKYSPSVSKIKDLTIHDFPGPGLVIYGLHSKLFPDNYLSKTFLGGGSLDSIDYEYGKQIVEGEKHLSETNFAFFRGGVLIYNPRKMKVNNEPYGLFIYNDHFPKWHLKVASLANGRGVERFMQSPYEGINEANIFHPNMLSSRSGQDVKLINLTSLAAQAGFCEEVKGIDGDVDDRRTAHDEVAMAAIFAIAQLDLIREAYRLYSLGYYYDRKKNDFYMDEFVMLRELLSINRVAAQRSYEKDELMPELPVAFPFTFLNHSVDPVKVSQIGFVGANLLGYKNNPKGDCMLFGGDLSKITPKEVPDISQLTMESMLGYEGLNFWREFLEGNNLFRANPMIVDPMYKKIGSGIIASSD